MEAELSKSKAEAQSALIEYQNTKALAEKMWFLKMNWH